LQAARCARAVPQLPPPATQKESVSVPKENSFSLSGAIERLMPESIAGLGAVQERGLFFEADQKNRTALLESCPVSERKER